uniref:Lymphoid-restricted membrane protein n=1 Tax=Pygocentrus nattereri TaxID=42514 RepID=A0AAR2ITL1_PYGNA
MFSHRFMASGGRVNVGFFHLICASPHTDCMCNHKDLLNFSADQKMSSQACEDHNVGRALVSEDDSEEGSRQDDSLAWNELSIMERLGPNSVDMTEEDLENAFSQLALAFRCDQYTLDQRLQAEEHARNNAEENLMLEVERGQDLLEALKGMCLDIKRAKVIQSLELCLNIIRGTIERIANTAEVLGAVHQEAKVSRAVELMVAHVENLRRRHERDSVELEEIKKQMQKSSRARQASEIWGKFTYIALFLSPSFPAFISHFLLYSDRVVVIVLRH